MRTGTPRFNIGRPLVGRLLTWSICLYATACALDGGAGPSVESCRGSGDCLPGLDCVDGICIEPTAEPPPAPITAEVPDEQPAPEPRPAPDSDECGNGLDDDLDGTIDEGCACWDGDVQPCYGGARDMAGIGACVMGAQRCGRVDEFGGWEACEAWGMPSEEICDLLDNDCDGDVDEECPCPLGESRHCYDGPAGTEDVGICHGGRQECIAGAGGSSEWGACQGTSTPDVDLCDGIDNDCDGEIDEACLCDPETVGECVEASPEGSFACVDGSQACVALPGGGSDFDECSGTVFCHDVQDLFVHRESTGERAVDIVIAVDQSSSMTAETTLVQRNLNAYSTAIATSGIDYNVILLAAKSGSRSVCIPPPLAGPGCGDSDRFHQIDRRVASSNALSLIESYISTIESHMRPGSLRAFLVVTDDNSSMSAAAFDSFLGGRTGYDDYVFDGIIGTSDCRTTASVGTVYQELGALTGGTMESICTPNWTQSFERFADALVLRTLVHVLSATPFDVDAIQVFYRDPAGIETEQVRGVVWTYDPVSNAISLDGDHSPPDGYEVVVRYATLT